MQSTQFNVLYKRIRNIAFTVVSVVLVQSLSVVIGYSGNYISQYKKFIVLVFN